MLRTVRERNERSLADTGLPFLFDATYRAIFARLEELARARAVSRLRFLALSRVDHPRLLQERERLGHELGCSVRLLLLLLRLSVPDDKCAVLEAAIGFEPRPSDRLVSACRSPFYPTRQAASSFDSSAGLGGDRGRYPEHCAEVCLAKDRHRGSEIVGVDRPRPDRDQQGAGQAKEAAGPCYRATRRLQAVGHRRDRGERRQRPRVRLTARRIEFAKAVT